MNEKFTLIFLLMGSNDNGTHRWVSGAFTTEALAEQAAWEFDEKCGGENRYSVVPCTLQSE